jgi:hypothetical protein
MNKLFVFIVSLIYIFLILPNTVFAIDHTNISSQFYKVYKNSYYNSSVYSQGNCSSNVWRFLGELKKNNVSLKNSQVIYFFNTDYADLTLLSSRNDDNIYLFHVVFMHNGQIYDFDFNNQPTILNTSTYFEQQILGSNGDIADQLIVKTYSAEKYLSEYSMSQFDEKNYYYYLLPEYNAAEEVLYNDFVLSL